MAVFDAVGLLALEPARWRCVQALALSYGLPAYRWRSSAMRSATSDHAKMAEGQKLIRRVLYPAAKDGRRIQPQEAGCHGGAFGRLLPP